MQQTVSYTTEADDTISISSRFPLSRLSSHVDWASLDLDHLCAAHVPLLQDVLEGRRFSATLRYGQAKLVFFHGCLMGRVYYNGHSFAFPPIWLDKQDRLSWRLQSLGDKFAQHEFLALPQDILIFFFNMLKLTFESRPVHTPTCHPLILQLFSEVNWKVIS